MYPNLFLIGAAKSGTSSLHYYLSLHPEIHMSLEKEPHYFSQLVGMVNPRLPQYDDAGYQALFATDRPVRGESSVSYSFWPYPPACPRPSGLSPQTPASSTSCGTRSTARSRTTTTGSSSVPNGAVSTTCCVNPSSPTSAT